MTFELRVISRETSEASWAVALRKRGGNGSILIAASEAREAGTHLETLFYETWSKTHPRFPLVEDVDTFHSKEQLDVLFMFRS